MNSNNVNPNNESEQQRIEFPSEYGVTQQLSENVILTTLDDVYNWARLSSLWPLMYGTACCFIELAGMIGSRFDFDSFHFFVCISSSTVEATGETMYNRE